MAITDSHLIIVQRLSFTGGNRRKKKLGYQQLLTFFRVFRIFDIILPYVDEDIKTGKQAVMIQLKTN